MFKSRFIFPLLTLFTATLLFTACSFTPNPVPSEQATQTEVSDEKTTDTPSDDTQAELPVVTQPENDNTTDKDIPDQTTDTPPTEDESSPTDKITSDDNTINKDTPDETTDNPPGENDNPNPEAETKN